MLVLGRTLRVFTPTQRILLVLGAILTAAAGIARATGAGEVPNFVLAGLALAGVAGVVGEAVDAIGERLGSSVTGLIHATLGNLPELFVGIFALRQGLVGVVRAALLGSILINLLLVLGTAFVVGGVRHGTQSFEAEEPRLNSTLLLLAVAALLVPTLAVHLNTPARIHATALSSFCAVLLLVVYACSVGASLVRGQGQAGEPPEGTWPLPVAAVVLVAAGVASAFASDWFVDVLEPAARSIGLSNAFTGLVVVALASNAVEHWVALRFAIDAKNDLVLSTTLSSPLQIALFLTPVLVLVSNAVGPSPLTLVFPPLLVVTLGVGTLVVLVVVFDGEYNWVEGVALVGLFAMMAGAFWWG